MPLLLTSLILRRSVIAKTFSLLLQLRITHNNISKYRYPNNRNIHDMAELSLEGLFGIGEAIGIIATLFVILYFSRKQMQSLSVDLQTKVLNDLDEKVHKMVEIIIDKPSMQKVMYKLESEELAFAYYILFICSHAYSMRQRKVLNDDEWAGWLQWMRNCFKYGTLGEQWEQIQSERWFNIDFQNFINKEVAPKAGSKPI
jgi:hypothetical protein